MEGVNKSGKLARILYLILFVASLSFIVIMLPDLQAISGTYAEAVHAGHNNPLFTVYFSFLTLSFGMAIGAVIIGGLSAIIKTERKKADALKAIAWFCALGSVAMLNFAFLLDFVGGKINGEAVGYVLSLPVILSCFITAVLSAGFVNKDRKHVVRSAAATVIIAVISVVLLTVLRSADELTYKYQSGTNYCFIIIIPSVLLSCAEALRHIDSFISQENSTARLRSKAAVIGIYAFVLLLSAQVVAFDLNLYSIFTIGDLEIADRYFLLFGFVSITNMFWLLVYVVPTIVLLILANVIAFGASKGKYNYATKLKAAAIVTIVFGAISMITMAVNNAQLDSLNKGWNAANFEDSEVDFALIITARYYNRFAYFDSLIGVRNTAFITLIPLSRLAAAIVALIIVGKDKSVEPDSQSAVNPEAKVEAGEQAGERQNADDVFNRENQRSE